MKLLEIIEISSFSILFMGYGFYLGQLHESMADLAGIIIFITGFAGLWVSLLIYYFTRKHPWHNKWYANILTSAAGCIIAFSGLVLYARFKG